MYRTHRQYLKGDMGRMWMKNPSDTLFLLHSDTTDTDTTIVDSGQGQATPVVAGNVEHSTDQQKFGATSFKFAGAGDYIDVDEGGTVGDWPFDPGTSDFTIDFWYYWNGGTEAGFFGKRNGAATYTAMRGNNSGANVTFHHNIDGGAEVNIVAAGINVPTSEWFHLAFVRYGDVFSFYLNGVFDTSTSDSSSIEFSDVPGNLTIGECKDVSNTYSSDGYIDEFRYVNGEALFTTNFIPPRGPYT